jgi:hypothetical protein
MATCSSCGRTIDESQAPGACTVCGGGARPAQPRGGRPPVSQDPAPAGRSAGTASARLDAAGDGAAALIGRLRDYASLAGEDLGSRELLVRRALERGNLRPYHAEVNRLAGRYVALLERDWA